MTTPFPFVAGSVLPAQSLNDITNLPINDQTASYTLVVGDAGKRVVMNVASANTVTVNDSVFTTGDTIFVANKGAGASTLTAGAGVTINSASGLVLVAHQSGQLVALSASSFLFVLSAGPAPAAGLVCVKAETTFSAAATITADGIFTSSFTNYVLQINFTAGNDLTIQLRAAGVTATGANYNQQQLQVNAATVSGARTSSATSYSLSPTSAASLPNYAQLFFYGPQLASPTGFQSFTHFHNSSTLSQPLRRDFFGNQSDSTAFDGFIITVGGSNATGTLAVYGYAKTV